MTNRYSEDEDIYQQIKTGNQKAVRNLYESYRLSFRLFLMRYYNADEQDAMDVYPEAFTKFYYNIIDGKLKPPLKSSLKTYLFSIGKHVFYKRHFNKYSKSVDLKEQIDDQSISANVLDKFDHDSEAALVQSLLEKIGEKCKELLTMIYINEFETEAIVSRLELPSNGALRKRKFDCLKKMRSLMSGVNF